MFRTLKEAFKIKELRRAMLFTLLLLLVYRIGCWIPCPGLNLAEFAEISSNGFMNLLSSITGGALSKGAILALGVSPYISASIIIQLLSIAIPSWERLAREGGDEGRKRISFYTKIAALILALVQAISIVVAYKDILNTKMFGFEVHAAVVGTMVTTILVAGSMFTYWLGEKITSLGISNGVSLLIFVGILSSAGSAILQNLVSIFKGDLNQIGTLVLFLVALILVFGFIVFIDLAERKVPVSYAKQIKGRKMYSGQNTHIPVRINATGVMPIIFATSILAFPQLLMSIFWPKSSFFGWYSRYMGTGTIPYLVVAAILILFFSYFWATVQFNPDDISRNIQQNGGFIPGIRPGKPTSEYLKRVSNRITLFGAVFLTIIFIIPSLVFASIGSSQSLINAFSTTGLLIVVSVAIELDKQLEANMMMRNYRGFLNK